MCYQIYAGNLVRQRTTWPLRLGQETEPKYQADVAVFMRKAKARIHGPSAADKRPHDTDRIMQLPIGLDQAQVGLEAC